MANFLIILTFLLFFFGFLENYFHQRRIQKIAVRIHVNGTRGKSTTVRLIAAALREAGYRVLAKTTGTSPRMILENGEEETIRRRGSPNIIEQKHFLKKAVQRGCNAVVLECMAVHPETQWVSEHRIIQSTIGVITNVREDHQDVYGPYLKDAAEALKLTIPRDSCLITAENTFLPLFRLQSEKMNTKCVLAAPENNLNGKYRESENFFFSDNVAIALEVSQVLGINKQIALQGMLKATPDPGALTIYQLKRGNKRLWFVNAFAANDRESILLIHDRLVNQILPKKNDHTPEIALVNHRDDRITRTIQFDKMLSRDINFHHILLAGPTSQLSRRKLIQFGYPAANIQLIKRGEAMTHIMEKIFNLIENNGVVYGLGNTRGLGLEIIEYFREEGQKI